MNSVQIGNDWAERCVFSVLTAANFRSSSINPLSTPVSLETILQEPDAGRLLRECCSKVVLAILTRCSSEEGMTIATGVLSRPVSSGADVIEAFSTPKNATDLELSWMMLFRLPEYVNRRSYGRVPNVTSLIVLFLKQNERIESQPQNSRRRDPFLKILSDAIRNRIVKPVQDKQKRFLGGFIRVHGEATRKRAADGSLATDSAGRKLYIRNSVRVAFEQDTMVKVTDPRHWNAVRSRWRAEASTSVAEQGQRQVEVQEAPVEPEQQRVGPEVDQHEGSFYLHEDIGLGALAAAPTINSDDTETDEGSDSDEDLTELDRRTLGSGSARGAALLSLSELPLKKDKMDLHRKQAQKIAREAQRNNPALNEIIIQCLRQQGATVSQCEVELCICGFHLNNALYT